MNLLNPQMRALASFSEDEQALFKQSIELLEVFCENGWSKPISNTKIYQSSVYRLKLAEGEWYILKDFQQEYIAQYIGYEDFDFDLYYNGELSLDNYSYSSIYMIKSIRPATQEEINSVQPKFKKGSLVKNTKGVRPCLARLGGSVVDGDTVIFEENVGCDFDYGCLVSMTAEEAEDYTLEEMKAGKKWNGECYDDCLTADGLTLNELLEHDLSEIEYYTSLCDWCHTVVVNKKSILNICNAMKTAKYYRLKPKQNYFDAAIEWKKEGGYVRINGNPVRITKRPIGHVTDGWALSGYIFNDHSEGKPNGCTIFSDKPIIFLNNGKEFNRKATHARFVSIT